jgi:hypothetical protein
VADRAVARALQKYGAIVADNGNFFSISVVPDSRWTNNVFQNLNTLNVGHFEVIQTTAENAGPRSPGAPLVNAGADRTANVGDVVALDGSVLYTNAAPLATRWYLYSGPTNASFANAVLTNTTVTFAAPGEYTLMLSASNGVHTTADDAVIINVMNGIRLNIDRNGMNGTLRWIGGVPPYAIESASAPTGNSWTVVTNVTTNLAFIPMNESAMFYRVRSP